MLNALLSADKDWFQGIFDISPDPSWIIDGNRFVACNNAAVQALGYESREELLDIHPSHLSPLMQPDGEDSFSKAEKMMAIAMERGIHRFEWMHAREDGTLFLAEVTMSSIEIDQRKVIYCVWRDITERKAAEEKLATTLSEMELIFQNARIGVIYLVERRFVRVNKPFENIFGYSLEELYGKTTRIIYASDEDYEAAGREFYSSIARCDSNNKFDINALTKHGDRLICELVGSLLDPQDPKKGSIWLFTDVTELRHTQEQVRLAKEEAEKSAAKIAASEALYRLLTEDALDVVWKVDSKNQVTYISPADERLRGFPAHEVIGQSMVQFFTEEGVAIIKEFLRHAPRTVPAGSQPQPLNFEAPHRCKNGQTIWGEVLAIPEVDASGKVVGYHGITRENTKRKIAEERLAHALSELEVIFQNPSTGIVYAIDRLIVRANKTFESMVGRCAEDIIGQSTRFLYPSDEAYEEAGRAIQSAFAAGMSCRYDIVSPCSDGSVRVNELLGTLVDIHRPERGSIWLFSDVTELRQAHHALQLAKETALHLAQRFQAANEQVSRLLNNSGQGFLSFDHQLRVDPIYSRACEALLGCNPSGQEVSLLLFPTDKAARMLMCECVHDALAEQDTYAVDLYLSLIPAELHIGGKTLHAQYIRIESGVMVILSNITEARNLEQQVERESRRMEMIVAALTDGPDFFAAIEEFREFAEADGQQRHLADLYRTIHTFKGTFNQFGFYHLPAALHAAEAILQEMTDEDMEELP